MGHQAYTKQTKEKIKLSPKPFASGGEGVLYKVEMPEKWQGHVAKVYHKNKRTALREQKMQYLLKNSPQNTATNSIIWCEELIYDDKGDFLGILMPLAKGRKLEILCSTSLPGKLPKSWYRFHRAANNSMELRLRICYNLAVAIYRVHACERYILVDLKPDNVIVQPNGLISLVDMDAVEVVEDGQKIYDAPVATPEYTPPEYYQNLKADPTQQQAWDRFSLAVIFYKLLTGIHPFAGSFKPPYDKATNLAQKIEQGLFVFNNDLDEHKKIIPPPHRDFYKLNKKIQDLFERCFVDGQTKPAKRPTAHEWCSVLLQCLDVSKARLLPSQEIEIVGIDKWQQLTQAQTKPEHHRKEWERAHGIASKEEWPSPEKILLPMSPLLRQLLLLLGLIAIIMAVLVFPSLGGSAVALIVVLFIMIMLATYLVRSEEVSRRNKAEQTKGNNEKVFLDKQKEVFNGIKKHLDNYYQKLALDLKKYIHIPNQKDIQNLQLELADWKRKMNEEVALIDKQAQQMLTSEAYEYKALNQKYIQELHTYPQFTQSTSLDAEIAATDFALQEKLEAIQKEHNRNFKKRKLEIEAEIEKAAYRLKKKEKDTKRKINKFKAYTKKAIANQTEKIRIKNERLINQKLTDVAQNFDKKITSFEKEIDQLLQRGNITNLTQIKGFRPPKSIVLADGKLLPIAPLKFYHLHELRDWWNQVFDYASRKTTEEMEALKLTYQEELKDFTAKAKKELDKVKKEVEHFIAKKAHQKNEIEEKMKLNVRKEVERIKEVFAKDKEILNRLFERKEAEEQKIHHSYEESYQKLITAAKEKADLINDRVRLFYCKSKATAADITRLEKAIQKYNKGLKRLQEEYQRLIDTQKRYHKALEQRETYRLPFGSYIKQILVG